MIVRTADEAVRAGAFDFEQTRATHGADVAGQVDRARLVLIPHAAVAVTGDRVVSTETTREQEVSRVPCRAIADADRRWRRKTGRRRLTAHYSAASEGQLPTGGGATFASMSGWFDTMPFDLRSSQWLQRALNESYSTVWSYWGDVHESFDAAKSDIERRAAYVLEHNNHDDLLHWAAEDRALLQGIAGPHRSVIDPDPLRIAAFRVVELDTRIAISDLETASLEPATENDFVCEQTPGLWRLLSERDRLLPLNAETWAPECKGNVPFHVVGDRAVYTHPLVIDRRELVLDLLALGRNGLDVKIAIDPARSTARADAADMLLADYWYGCSLTRETIDSLDPRHLGTTWHVRPPDRETFLDTHPVAATVFSWGADGHVKKLEVIEIAPRDSWSARYGPYVVNRYLHALRDTKLKRFTHVDGAARAHAAQTYEATNDNPKASCGEVLNYRKLFRVDGVIDDADWGRIVAHYFRGNELVIEYFGELADARGWAPAPGEPPTVTAPAMRN